MKNILLMGESYSGGVKTYIDTITMNMQHVPGVHFQTLVSSKRLENEGQLENNYLVDDNLSFGKSPLKMASALRTIHQVVKERNIRAIHANSTLAGVLMSLYSFWNRKLFYIYTPHGYYSFKDMGNSKKFAVRLVEKLINHCSDLVIHVSPSEEREAIRMKLVSPAKSVVILNGVKDPEAGTGRDSKRVFTIVNLARVDNQKNPFEFIRIARKVLQAIPDVQFIWAGNGEFLEEARGQVMSCGLEGKIKFIGFSAAKEKILEQSDLYFSTSHYEGLPFAVVEAMSYKLPLLLSDIVGHKDLIEGQDNGLLFKDSGDPEIYGFIEMLFHSREKWNSLSGGSYKVFTERFNIKQMMEKLSEVYDTI